MVRRLAIVNELSREETIPMVVDFFNSVDPEEPVEIVVYSEGGDVNVAEYLAEVINERGNITLVGLGQINSACVLLFYYANCDKIIYDTTVAIVHKQRVENITVFLDNKRSLLDSEFFEILDNQSYERFKDFDEKLKKVVTEDTFERYERNEDIFLSSNDIRKLIN